MRSRRPRALSWKTGSTSRGMRARLMTRTRPNTQFHWRSATSRTSTSRANDMPTVIRKNRTTPIG
jgi:hypothetical protein